MSHSIHPKTLKQILENHSESQKLDQPACFLFNRVSTKNEEQETSLEQQESDSFRYAQRHGLNVVYNFRVQETASKEEQRHTFNQMVQILKSELINVKHVIFKSADRSSRNKFDKDVLDKLRKNHGISIHYYSSGKVLHGSSHYTEELQDDIENLFATHFSRELSHKIRAAHDHKAFEKKQAPGTRPPYGYFWDKNQKQHKIDPKAEPILREIFRTFDKNNFTLSEFVDHCNKRKLRTQTGASWQKGTLEKLLKNPFYHGWFHYKGGVYEGSHEPYYSKTEYEERLKKMSSKKFGTKTKRLSYLLSKYGTCPNCGTLWIGDAQSGAHNSGYYIYYKHECLELEETYRFREEAIMDKFDDVIRRSRFSPDFAEKIKDLFREPLEKNRKGNKKEVAALGLRIEKLQDKISRMYDLYSEGEIDKVSLSLKIREYDAQLTLVQQQRDSLEKPPKKVYEKIVAAIALMRELPEFYLSAAAPPQKIEILKKIAAGFTLDVSGNLEIDWHAPFGLLMRRPEFQEALELESVGPLRKKQAPAAPEPIRTTKKRVVGKAATPRPSQQPGAAAEGGGNYTNLSDDNGSGDSGKTNKAARNERPNSTRNDGFEAGLDSSPCAERQGTESEYREQIASYIRMHFRFWLVAN